MPTKLRIGSFNCENLFSRAKLINYDNQATGTALLNKFAEFNKLIAKTTYDKPAVKAAYDELAPYIKLTETRGKLMSASGSVSARGRGDWEGWVDLKRDKISDEARANTAQVVKDIKVDVCGLIEVEDRPLLKQFLSEKFSGQGKFDHNMLIDGNDDRGIDVALVSKHPIRGIWSHIDDSDSSGTIFSRDCLEVQVEHPQLGDLYLLVNHLKSKGYGDQTSNDRRRKKQATRLAEILGDYNLKSDKVVVLGDLNDTPDSDPLSPLLGVPNLHDVLALQFPQSQEDRWTYYYNGRQQIDYVLVSKPLKDAFVKAGVYRRGIHRIDQYSTSGETPLASVTSKTNSASDHGAVWAEFSF